MRLLFVFVCVLNCNTTLVAQTSSKEAYVTVNDSLPGKGPEMVDNTYFLVHAGCKSMLVVPIPPYPLPYTAVRGIRVRESKSILVPEAGKQRKPFLVVHGNVMYDLYYQSNADTPYLEKELYQHTLQTYLDITVKDQYPIRLAFSTQQGNSSLFRNITGLNMQYTNRDFKNMLMQKAQQWDAGRLQDWQQLEELKQRINNKLNEINALKSREFGPSQLQMLVEAKERELYAHIRDSLEARNPRKGNDSLYGGAQYKADSVMQLLKINMPPVQTVWTLYKRSWHTGSIYIRRNSRY